MNEYETQMLITELQKLVVSKQATINCKDYEIARLKERVEHLEKLAKKKQN